MKLDVRHVMVYMTQAVLEAKRKQADVSDRESLGKGAKTVSSMHELEKLKKMANEKISKTRSKNK